MADEGSGRRTRAARKRSTARTDFQPDPGNLIPSIGTEFDIVPVPGGAGSTLLAAPTHRFRLLRPADLVVVDVFGYHLEMRADADGLALVPKNGNARLEVRFPFQHLAEAAYYRAGKPVPPEPPGGDPGNETPASPPIPALAAQPSRLVFDVPTGERIGYDIESVLAAMSRLPLRVAPLATARTVATRPGPAGFGTIVELATLPGGFLLGRTDDGRAAITSATAAATAAARKLPATERVLSQGIAMRAARTLLAGETATDLSRKTIDGAVLDPRMRTESTAFREVARGIGDMIVRPVPRIPRIKQRPRAPKMDETSIEAPFRLIVSPSVHGGFAHSVTPTGAGADTGRVELWHTRLGVRQVDPDDGTVHVAETRHPQRVIRAIWARDKTGLDPNADIPADNLPFRMSLNARDRVVLVRQSSDPLLAPPTPVDVDRFHLSALGAYLDVHGRWTTTPYTSKNLQGILAWDHEAQMGRDQYVRVVYPGYFFPFGHRCALVKVTERKILDPTSPKAYLYQRKFIVVSQPVRTFDDRRMPFRQVTLRPLVTPDIVDPLVLPPTMAPLGEELFWPVVGDGKFEFTLDCIDHDGHRVRLQAPLLFVAEHLPADVEGKRAGDIRTVYKTDRRIPGQGQTVSYAPGITPGDTSFEAVEFRFDGIPGPAGSTTSTPFLEATDIVVPAMRHLAPTAPVTTVHYAEPYLDLGFGGRNTEAQVFFELDAAAVISFSSGTDRAGGFIQPDLPVRGLSRALGAVGEIDDLVNAPAAQKFNPAKFLAGALPRLFGLFELTDILEPLGLDAAPTFITERLDQISALLADIDALQATVQRSADRLTTDIAGAPTAALKAQAEAARARLQAVAAQLQPRADEFVAALEALLDLGASSTVEDVEDAVRDALDVIAAQVADLRGLVRDQPLPPPVKAELERLLNAIQPAIETVELITKTIDAITQFVNGLDPAGLAVRASYEWRPTLTNYPDKTSDKTLFVVRPDGFLLSVEARASGSDGVGVDVLAELRDFALNLFPVEPLMRLGFDRIAFRAASGRKPEVDVVFRGIEFVGVLGFIETLKELIPFDAFSDPPYVDVSPEGVTAGFDLALPSVSIGVFSLENISLAADARVPFLGEAVTIGFSFCSREKPFRLTVMMIGGGGFVGIRLSPRGLVLLEMALEGGASLSIDLGVASGSVSIMIGIYLRLEAETGSLTGYFRIRGEVDVMGLISASITLELALTYEFDTGKMEGRASLVIEIEVLLFSGSVTVTCRRRFAGSNGDPTLLQIMGVEADGSSPAWSRYCAAFAED